MRERPLSPHLQIYKFKYTLTSSIASRITGAILSVGLLVLVYWLVSVASGPEAHARASAVLSHPLLQLVYLGLIVSFVYHLLAGIRHLVWDTGRYMERGQSRRSAHLLGVLTVILSLVLAYFVFFGANPQ